MAFGSKMKEKINTSGSGSGDGMFTSPFVDNHSGVRIFRILPALDENGKNTDETPDEIVLREAWWKARKGDTEVPVRVVLDWRNPFADPLWNYVAENYEKGSPERRNFKTKFAFNVLDKTPVLRTEEGQIIYADEKNKFVRVAGTSKILGKALTGDPKPLNEVRILLSSFGPEGGKHDFQQLLNAVENVEDPSTGEFRKPHQFDLRWKITGEGIGTNRNFFPHSNFAPLDPKYIYLPRYDLEEWAKPWPHDALEALLEGQDLDHILEEWNIQLYPQLKESSIPESTPDYTDPETYKTKGKRKSSTAKFEE